MVRKAVKYKGTTCRLASRGDYRTAAELAVKFKFVCRRCCRVARRKRNLCKPERI
jgi:hypothetical protein